MSAKWRRVQRWDAEHLTGPLTPVRLVLHTLSSIWFGVSMLVIVALYGALASIPIGLVALAPTWAVIALTVVVAVGAGGALLGLMGRMSVPKSKPGWRFAATMLPAIAGGVAGAWAWSSFVWPALIYDPASGEGLRFFPAFVEAYGDTTLRRLPGFEMTELEFYSWWPLRIVLVLFVVSMATATIRRIEFTFKNLGVLTVHTGIITIALGSVYYQGLKKEGDALLRAGMPTESGDPSVGNPVRGFYDNTAVALWVAQRTGPTGTPLWESRRLSGVPRYNDYGLDVTPAGVQAARVVGPGEHLWDEPHRELSIDVPGGALDPVLGIPRIDDDIRFRLVGYAEYATPVESLLVLNDGSEVESGQRVPLRIVDLLSRLPDQNGVTPEPDQPTFTFSLRPGRPAGRISENSAIAVEYTIGMDQTRVRDLTSTLPAGSAYGLVVEIPSPEGGPLTRAVVPARAGLRHTIGDTGWAVGIRQVHPQPPFPIITPGFEDAASSVAIVEITKPDGSSYDRWVYHRFPEINQDMLPGETADGRPQRRDADPEIRVALVDASKLQVYFDEPEAGGPIRAIVREPGGGVRMVEGLGVGEVLPDVVEMIDFRVTERFDHAVPFEHPMPVPEAERDNRFVGTHGQSLLAVEVSADRGTSGALAEGDAPGERGRWSTVVWVPFLQYLGTEPSAQRVVEVPGGRSVTLQFGRVFHGFPGFAVQLIDFEMIAYDHRGAPRDYQSLVRVSPFASAGGEPMFEGYEHITKLNAPLTAPFIWSDERSLPANIAMRLTSGLNPNQFKLSQAGWDQDGWAQTQQLADAGQIPRPFARYTILQVGNNPGIHIIALGGVMMAVGIPWAFYVKPWLVRRERDRLKAAAKNGARATNEPRSKTTQKDRAPEPVTQP